MVEPNNHNTFQSNISIDKIAAGYRNIADMTNTGMQFRTTSVDCDPSVMCRQDKMVVAKAVARFIVNIRSKFYYCTGTLLNNELNNGRPFFLIAFHCLDVGDPGFPLIILPNGIIDPEEESGLASASFQFQIWSTTCSGSTINSGIAFIGAVLRAQYRGSDGVLLELTHPPGIGDGVNYAGWSRQTYDPSNTNSFIIHHPQTKDMRITTTRNVRTWLYNSSYWTAHYSSGTVDKGSSGAALFNESNQVIGQLKGGWSNCNFTDFGDRYGKFSYTWNGGGLQQWLSPTQGLQSTEALILSPLQIQGNDAVSCTGQTQYSVPNLLDATYQWQVSSNLQIVSGQGTSTIMVTPNGSGNGSVTVIINTPTKGTLPSGRSLTVSKNVVLNSPAPVITATQTSGPGEPTSVRFTATPALSGITYNWYVNGLLQQSSPANTFDWYFPCRTTSTINCTITTSCGTSAFSNSISPTGECIRAGAYALSPNPAINTLTISTPPDKKSNEINDVFIDEIKIYDLTGNLKKQQKFKKVKTASINISDMKMGTYLVEIIDGDYKERQQLIITK